MASATGTTIDQNDEAGVPLPIATQPGQTLSPAQTAQLGGAAAAAPIGQTANPDPGPHTYVLGNGAKFQSPSPLSDDDLEHLAKSVGYTPDQWKAADKTTDLTNQKSILSNASAEAKRSIMEGVNGLVQGGGALLKSAASKLGDDDDVASIGNWLDARQDKYNDMMAHQEDLRADTPDYDQVNSLPSAAKYLTGNIASALPQVAAAVYGGPAAFIGTGAAQNVGAITPQTRDPLSMGLAAGTGALESAVAPKLVGGGTTVTGKLVRGIVGNSVGGALGGALANVPTSPETGDPLPSGHDILRGLIQGATVGPVLGHVFGGTPADPTKASAPVDVIDPANEKAAQARADSAVADRYASKTDSSYPSASKAGGLNDSVHTDVAQALHDVGVTARSAFDPTTADSIDDTLERAGVNATLRTGQNKLKGDITPDQIQNMLNLKTNANPDDPDETLGQTKQGAQLADLLRQSKTVSKLSRGNQLAGLAKLTAKIDPLSGLLPGGNRSIGGLLGELGAKVGVPAAIAPHISLPLIGGLTAADVAARGIGKVGQLTGLFPGNSKLGNFMQKNSGVTPPIDFTGLRDIQADNMAMQRMGALQDQATAENQQIDQQKQADTKAVLAAQAAKDAQNVQSNAVPPSAMMNQQAAQAQATQVAPAATQARMAMRQAELDANEPGHPNSFNGRVYARTGLKPQEALAAVKQLADNGTIPHQVHAMWRDDPTQLQAGNVGSKVIDRLASMQGKSDIKPDLQASQRYIDPLRKAAYDAQANGNQARATNADAHILSRGDLSDKSKGLIRSAIHGISSVTNKLSASAIRDGMLARLDGHERDVADSVVSPLVEQIRHDTPAQSADAAFKDPGTQQAIDKTADKMAKGDFSDLTRNDADMVKMFTKQAEAQGKTGAEARLYGMLKMSQWVEAGRPAGNGN